MCTHTHTHNPVLRVQDLLHNSHSFHHIPLAWLSGHDRTLQCNSGDHCAVSEIRMHEQTRRSSSRGRNARRSGAGALQLEGIIASHFRILCFCMSWRKCVPACSCCKYVPTEFPQRPRAGFSFAGDSFVFAAAASSVLQCKKHRLARSA
jgi:hypothetical protein